MKKVINWCESIIGEIKPMVESEKENCDKINWNIVGKDYDYHRHKVSERYYAGFVEGVEAVKKYLEDELK